MNEILQSPLTVSGIVLVLGSVIGKLYLDGKAYQKNINDISQARVNDLKEINAAKDSKDDKMAIMVQLIYDKLEKK